MFSVELTLLIVRLQKVTTILVMSYYTNADNVLDFFLKVPGLIITGGKYNLDIQSSIEVFSANDTGCSIPRLPNGG